MYIYKIIKYVLYSRLTYFFPPLHHYSFSSFPLSFYRTCLSSLFLRSSVSGFTRMLDDRTRRDKCRHDDDDHYNYDNVTTATGTSDTTAAVSF